MAIRLNIGAGPNEVEGFISIDHEHGKEAFPLPQYETDSVDEICASHILEHFSFEDVNNALAEWVRVLKPGSRLCVAVPDVDRIAAMPSDPRRLFYLMGGQMNADDFHRSAFDTASLTERMKHAGLESIKPWDGDGIPTAHLPISLNLQGVKVVDSDAEKSKRLVVNICAVMSIPRLGWNANWGCVMDALRPFGIPVHRATGAYWDQCIQNAFEKCVDEGVDWILTIDYDSMFNKEHISALMGYLGANPNIDALAAMQCRRGKKLPLLTIEGMTEKVTDGTPFQVTTAHFGLTLIRIDALKDVPKPWFHHHLDKDGRYGEDRLDADISFWDAWKKAGKTVYVAPNVRIGHLELMVSQLVEKDGQLDVRHVHTTDWLREFYEGKTEGVG